MYVYRSLTFLPTIISYSKPLIRNHCYVSFYRRFFLRSSSLLLHPVYFDYAGRTWLIKFWKGQYGRTWWLTSFSPDCFTDPSDLTLHLSHYYQSGFSYIELGDGDELWENRNMTQIIDVHSDVFWLLSRFYQADFFNSVLWRLTRFLVRYVWRPLEHFGVLDPTVPV